MYLTILLIHQAAETRLAEMRRNQRPPR